MKLYIKSTGDELDLPVAVAESPTELARMIGTNRDVVLSSIAHKRKGWARVEVEDEDERDPRSDVDI